MTAIYTDARCLDHYAAGHPERPERVSVCVDALREAPEGPLWQWPEVEPADPAVLALAHPEEHVGRIRRLAEAGGGWTDPDTFVGPGSYDAARYAAGAAVQAVRDVLAGVQSNAFVVVRPPGHHATRQRSMGFCLFNNAAVATLWALEHRDIRRVAILDIDVHHGNGTQEIFFDRREVLYLSFHQYPHYPGTGTAREVGAGQGTGATINVPLVPGCGDPTYLAATERVLGPATRRFEPDCILVSLGFDAHWADPLANMCLSLAGYGAMLDQVVALAGELCPGRLVLLLEGGYDLRVLAEGARTAACLLAGQPAPNDTLGAAPEGSEPSSAKDVIEAVCAIHGLGETVAPKTGGFV